MGEGIKAVAMMLADGKALPNLETLSLNCDHINALTVKARNRTFQLENSKGIYADRRGDVPCKGIKELIEILADSKVLLRLETLNLKDNRIGVDGLKALAKMLADGNAPPNLETLNLHCRPWWYSIYDHEEAMELATRCAGGTSLQKLKLLDLGYQRISDGGVQAFFEMLAGGEALQNLQALDLSGNSLGAKGMKAFATMLSHGTSLQDLKTLNLNRCISVEGMQALATVLVDGKALPNLETLNLRRNSIGDEGMQALSKALADGNALQNLKMLDLSYNRIRDQGVKALVKVLADGKALQNLESLTIQVTIPQGYLNLNGICNPHVIKKKKKKIQEVNCIGDEGMAALEKLLADGTALANLETLDLGIKTLLMQMIDDPRPASIFIRQLAELKKVKTVLRALTQRREAKNAREAKTGQPGDKLAC